MVNRWSVLLLLCLPAFSFALAQETRTPRHCNAKFPEGSIDGTGTIRFFWTERPFIETSYPPLAFVAVDDRDTRIGTAPMSHYGRTIYISKNEMRQMEGEMAHLPLSWCLSKKVTGLEQFSISLKTLPPDIKIWFSNGTATALLRDDQFCGTIASLDSTIKTPRALWELQYFRIQFSCEIPVSFRSDAYPDH
jgi:hypothetical protein